jgi:hypothetical protein
MNMLSGTASDCIFCNPGKFAYGEIQGPSCAFHAKLADHPRSLQARATALLQQAWNVDHSRPELADLMQGWMKVEPDPSIPPPEVDDPDDRGILPQQSRRELDDANGGP